MHKVTIFEYESNDVRSITIDNEPWFVAKDVCDILGLVHIANALDGLDEDDLTVGILQSGGQNREIRLVNESGLYNLIFFIKRHDKGN